MSVRWTLRVAVAAVLLLAIAVGTSSRASATGPVMVATLAGGFANDGGTALSTEMDTPQAVARDSSGNLYILDSKDCRVRKMTGTTVTSFAGTGACGYGGDGGPATAAALKGPQGIAIDGSGNVYIADTGNCRIRKVSGGTITTVAGFGFCFYSGDGGPAIAAGLNLPFGVAVNTSGTDLYIADAGSCRIRKVTGGTITTVVGSGTCGYSGDGGAATAASLSFPQGVAVDSSDNLYIADTNNCLVRKVTGGNISLLAGHIVIDPFTLLPAGSCAFDGNGLTATSSALFQPGGVALSGSNVYISDTDNCLVRVVTGGLLNTVAGNGTCGFAGDAGAATSAQLSLPAGLVLDGSGNVFIADSANCRVREVIAGVISTVAGNGACGYGGDTGEARRSDLHGPSGVAVTTTNIVYIADTANCRVRKVTAHVITTVAGTGTCGDSGDGGPATSAALDHPQGVAVDAANNLYIADTGNCRIRKVTGTTISTVAGTGICGYSGDAGAATSAKISPATSVAFDTSGNMYIGDTGNCRIRKITGTTISTFAGNGTCAYAGDGGAATSASLWYPHGIALDTSNNLYIADTANCLVRKVSGGTITKIAGTTAAGLGVCSFAGDGGAATSAQLSSPQGVRVDSSGNVYIADTANCRIRKITSGTISTYAGTGTCWFAGDFGSPTAAALNNPYAIALDTSGNMFVADTENNRVRVIAGDTDGDTLPDAAETIGYGTDPLKADTDGDGCGDGKEVTKFFIDPLNSWDFYSVPVPALYAAPNPTTTFKDQIVSASDAQAVFAYFKKAAHTGTLEYEQDLNVNGVKDGLEYDRSVAAPGKSGAPDGRGERVGRAARFRPVQDGALHVLVDGGGASIMRVNGSGPTGLQEDHDLDRPGR